MNDRLDGIAVFVQVVESGNFAAAADRLHLTRSAVGKAIARLEQRLGVRLFQRTTRQQSLTEAGQVFYEHSLRVLAELRLAEAAVESDLRRPRGTLRVSVPILYGRLRVAPLLTRLVREYDEMNLEISFSDRTIDLVQEGVDLAVRIGPLLDTPSLVARRIGTVRMVICAAPEYFERQGKPETLTDLAHHTGIVYRRPGYESHWLVGNEERQIQPVTMASRLSLDDVQAVADAALSGLGLAWLPCWLVTPYLEDGRLQLALGEYHALESGVHALWPKAAFLPSKTRVAIDCLVEHADNSPLNW